MLKAVKFIRRPPSKPITIHDSDKRVIHDDSEKIEAIKTYYTEKYSGPNPITPQQQKKPLSSPITTEEVQKSIKLLNSNRAPGLDTIKAEFLKACSPNTIAAITSMYNSMFEEGEQLNLGTGKLILLQKPGNLLGPCQTSDLLSSSLPFVKYSA